MASLMLTLAVKPRHHTPRQFPATLEGGGDASVYLPARRASLLVDTCPVSFRLLQLEEARSLRLSRRGMHAGFSTQPHGTTRRLHLEVFFFFFLMGSSWRF